MSDLAAIVEQQLDTILAEAEPAWLDREPEVREEVSFVGFDDDTYAHQRYAYYTRKWQEEAEKQHKQLFGSPEERQQEDDPMLRFLQQMVGQQQEDFDGPTP
jgi:hypothetical protein